MKKKLVSYLILACSVFGLAMVGSCKDYEDEFKGYRSEIDNLKTGDGTLKARIDSVSNAVQNIKSCACDPTLKARLDSLYDFLGDIASDSTGLATGYSGGLSYVLNQMNQQIANAAAKAYSDSIDSVLGKRIDSLKCFWPDTLYQAYVKSHLVHDSLRLISDSIRLYKDSVLLDQHSARLDQDSIRLFRDSVAIDSIIKKLDILSAEHAKFVDSITLADSIKAVEARYKKADSIIMDTLRVVAKRLDAIADSVNQLWKSVDTLKLRVDTLENRVDSLMDAEKMRITSLYVQGTVNPAFGTFALPFGVRSNVLMAYYGDISSVKFPTTQTANMVDESTVITAREATLLSLSSTTESFSGTIFGDSVGNAGKIYFTVNPNEVEIDTSKYHFGLQNSLGQAVKATLDSIKPSDEKLTFGFNFNTRAAGDPVALYEAAVTIKGDDAESLQPDIDRDALIKIAKDLKNFRDGISLTSISKSILGELDGVLDANALTVNWEDSMGKHYVTSGYDVAVAAVTPLGYGTLQRILPTTSRRIPANPIDEVLSSITAPSVNLTFTPITMGAINFTIAPVTYTANLGLSDISVDVEIKDVNPPYSQIGTATVTVPMNTTETKMEDAINAVIDSINGSLIGVRDSVKKLVTNIQNQISDQVNDMLGDVEGQLETQVNSMFTNIKNQIASNKYVSKINALANKINKVLDNIDELANISMLYEGADGELHSMSASYAVPSTFTGTGSIVLYPTSLTAEILTPAYKKFVAVTNVIDATSGKDAKADDDATCKTKLIAANSSGDFNTMLEGSTQTVTFTPSAGYIYEVLYSVLDYNGDITNRRFYVRVK